MKTIPLFLFLLFVLVNLKDCSAKKELDQAPMIETNEMNKPSRIRLKNASGSDFTNVRVVFPSQEENYGDLKKGQVSEYRTIQKAFGYAYIELLISEEKFVLQPTDYSGEIPLGEGNFTYVLDANIKERALDVTLIKD